MKLMIAAFDALAIGALIALLRVAGRDPAELLIYAWLPLPVWEFAGNAHIDGAAAGLLALALLLAVRGRRLWTGVVLAAAALTKFLPAVVLPAFWRPPDWRLPIAFAATLVVFYLPYVADRSGRCWAFCPAISPRKGWQNGSGIFLLQTARQRHAAASLGIDGSTSHFCWACSARWRLASPLAGPLPAAAGAARAARRRARR